MKKPFAIKLIKPNQKLVRMILKNRPELSKKTVEAILGRNILTSSHMGLITGKRADAIITMSKVELRNDKPYSKLTRVMPFRLDGEGDNTKMKFIENDAKAEKFIVECNS